MTWQDEQIEKQIHSPQFKEWFGDWENDPANASKAVDKNGKPLVLYHGSPKVYSKFKTFKNKNNIFFFTDDKETADWMGGWRIGEESNVFSCYLNMRNPKIFDADENYWFDLYGSCGGKQDFDWGTTTNDFCLSAKHEGYDGVIIYNVYEGDEGGVLTNDYVVFSSTQIKSIDNNGNFDPKSENIYESKLGLFCEALEQKDYKAVLKLRNTNPKFKKDTDKKLKDLPENCKYSFEEHVWESGQDSSIFELYDKMYHDFSSLYNRTKLLLSEDNEEILGWVTLETYKGVMAKRDTVFGVKFGSFNPENISKNYIFFKQLKKYLKENLKNYNKVYFSGTVDYPFVRHYIDICAEYDGVIILNREDNNYLEFCIGEKADKEDLDYILIKEEYEGKSPKEVRKLLLKKKNS